jgi:hypothetical protein
MEILIKYMFAINVDYASICVQLGLFIDEKMVLFGLIRKHVLGVKLVWVFVQLELCENQMLELNLLNASLVVHVYGLVQIMHLNLLK